MASLDLNRNQQPAVDVQEIGHRYGPRQALNGVSFTVDRGTIFGLLGPNGGGKTTLLRILSTMLMPTAGVARVLGWSVVQSAWEVRRRFGVVFQAPSLDRKLTAEENLWHQGHLYGLRGRPLRRRIEQLLEQFGLADRATDSVGSFSGGMQRRLEVAKGLLHQPELLLLDEPTTGLDPGARRDLWQFLNQIRESDGVTILVTTHLMEEAERCDRLVILDRGRVVAEGSPAQLKQEIGGEVIDLIAHDPAVLRKRIREQFGMEARLLGGSLRVECGDGRQLVSQLMQAFPDQFESITIGKPSLEDVFIHRTGRRFWDEPTQETTT